MTTTINGTEFEDRTLGCSDCGKAFIWTAGEQAFFQDKGLQNPPKRCVPCRRAKRADRDRQKMNEAADASDDRALRGKPDFPSRGRGGRR